jgi:hypothetical protein
MNEFAMGFVAVFEEPLNRIKIEEIVGEWLENFEKVEQVSEKDIATLEVTSIQDITWPSLLQFRVLNGTQYAWAYLSEGGKVIETTGTPNGEEVSLSLDIVVRLPGVVTVISDKDDKRLDELERQGIL